MWCHQLKIIWITTLKLFLMHHSAFIFKSRVSGVTNYRDRSQMPFNSQPNQFSKLYVIKEEINTDRKSIKEWSRFIMYLAHSVQFAGSSKENRLSSHVHTETVPLMDSGESVRTASQVGADQAPVPRPLRPLRPCRPHESGFYPQRQC